MKNITARFFIPVAICSSLLMGCEDPAVEVGVLGKKLAAPVLQSASPFDQTYKTANYVHLTGACDNRVGDLSVSFKISVSAGGNADVSKAAQWITPNPTPDMTGTTLSGVTNDVNCADGSFDFYLTKNDISALWGFDANSSYIDVSEIDLKGSTLIGDTQTLTLVNSHSGSSVATTIHIEKQWPRGFAGSGQCQGFNVFLTDSNNNFATAPSSVTFNIAETIGSNSATNIYAFSSWEDCHKAQLGSLAGVQSFTIPAGQNNLQVVYMMPSSPSAYDATLSYQAVASGLTSAAADHLVLRNSAGSRYLVSRDSANFNGRIHKDTCYPINFYSYSYNLSEYPAVSDVPLTFQSSNSKLKFYTSSNCTTEVTSLSIAAGATNISGGVRYVSDGTETADSLKVAVTMTSSVSSYDLAPFGFDVDIAGASIASKIDLWGPDRMNRAACAAFTVASLNDRWAPIPVNAATSVSLTSTATGTYFTDSNCTYENTSATVSIPAGGMTATIYFKGNVSTNAGSYILASASTGLTGTTRSLTINPIVADRISFNIGSSGVRGSCIPANIYPMDGVGLIPPSGTINFNYVILSSMYASLSQFYLDSNCSNALSPSLNYPLSPYDSLSYRVYMKSSTPETSTSFNVGGDVNGTVYSGSYSILWQ